MEYKDPFHDQYYWNSDVQEKLPSFRGKYIAVNGNTGAGKSTLVNALTTKLQSQGLKSIGINERVIHHPLLKLMFSAPKDYAYFIQLNFNLQRHLMLHRWLSLGYHVIVERSHYDDQLFMEHHFESENITAQEYSAYLNLTKVMNQKLPDPDLYIFLKVHPEVSFTRIALAEETGERPREFPSDEIKMNYIRSWFEKYNSFVFELIQKKERGEGFSTTDFLSFDADLESEILMEKVLSHLKM